MKVSTSANGTGTADESDELFHFKELLQELLANLM